jgi:hypothetical protein
MKKFMSVFAAIFVMFAVLMVSCDKDETGTSFSVNLLKKATIKGYVYAQLDLTTDGLEKAPPATRIVISIPYNNLNSLASGNYKDTAFVNAEGSFEIEVPVGTNNATVTIIPLPFETNQVQALGSVETPIKKYYTMAASSITLSASDYEIVEIIYTVNAYADYVEMAQISGVLYAEANDTSAGSEEAAAGISLTFHGDGWNKTVTTSDGGVYSVTVPANDAVSVDYSFTAQHVIWDIAALEYLPVPYLYEITAKPLGSYSAVVYENVAINAGYGEPVE